MIFEALTEDECYLAAILQDTSGIDLAEFCMPHPENAKTHGIFRAWPFQYPWLRNESMFHVDAAARLVGKALDLDTPIMTIDGWKTFGELSEEDIIFAPDGSPTPVETAFDVMLDRPCFELDFGVEQIVADAEHQWSVCVNAYPPEVLQTIEIKELFLAGNKIKLTPNHKGEEFEIENIKMVETRPVRCIEVEHESKLFMVGKNFIPTHNTLSISIRALAFAFNYPGQEMMITAPEQVHVKRVTDDIKLAYRKVYLAEEMLARPFTERPFFGEFINGARMYSRIPQRDGSGVMGAHPTILELDEGGKYPEKGWDEIKNTLKTSLPQSRWKVHGVPFGSAGTFADLVSGRKDGWAVTRLPAMITPLWNDELKARKVSEHNGYNTANYRRQELGLVSDAGSPIFSIRKLMACVDANNVSDYNEEEYYLKEIEEGTLADAEERYNETIEYLLRDIPSSHKSYKHVWIGMDFGWSQSPSSICVFAEVPYYYDDKGKEIKNKDGSVLKLISRILLHKIAAPDQGRVIKFLMNFYRPVVLAGDITGAGNPVHQYLQDEFKRNPEMEWMRSRLKDCNFSSKVIASFDESIEYDENDPEGYLDSAVMRPFIEASTDSLRTLVNARRVQLPWDLDLVYELENAELKSSEIGKTLDEYGRSGRKKGLHNLDAMRMAAFSYDTHWIDYMKKEREEVWEPPPMMFF